MMEKITLSTLTQTSTTQDDLYDRITISDSVDIWFPDGANYLSKQDAITLANLIKEAIRIGLDINPDDPVAGLQDAHQSYKFFLQKLEEDKPLPNTHTFITKHKGGRKHTYTTKPQP